MSRIKFNQLADDVAKSFGTDRELIFKRSKKPTITQPRHILWLLADRHAIRPCSSWPMCQPRQVHSVSISCHLIAYIAW